MLTKLKIITKEKVIIQKKYKLVMQHSRTLLNPSLNQKVFELCALVFSFASSSHFSSCCPAFILQLLFFSQSTCSLLETSLLILNQSSLNNPLGQIFALFFRNVVFVFVKVLILKTFGASYLLTQNRGENRRIRQWTKLRSVCTNEHWQDTWI